MKANLKRVALRLVLILILVGALLVLERYPTLLQKLPWMDGEEQPSIDPDDPSAPDDPADPTDPTDPVEPTDPETPADPADPGDESQTAIVSVKGRYYTYAQMKEQLLALEQRYPEQLKVEKYGTSADGRYLYAATLGNPNAPKQIVITAGMHAREYVNCYVVMRQLEYYLQNYGTGRFGEMTYASLFDEVALVVVPMTNPDGITLAQEGLEAIRSEALRLELVRMLDALAERNTFDRYLNTQWKSNARGVDLNRNFDTRWAEYEVKEAYALPTFKEYKGEMAGSETETAALVALTRSLTNPVASVCVHSQGNIIYWRCDQTGDFERENERLAEIAAGITGYRIIDENQTEPSYSNWTVLALGIPTITVENGLGGYPQSYDMADGFFVRNRDLWAAVALEYREADR